MPGFICFVISLNLIFQFLILSPGLTFHKRRSQVRNSRCIRTPFSHHTLSHISDRIIIKMSAYQPVRPVVTTECHLFLRSKFQTTVCPEMDHRIGTESISGPQISSDIGMRRCGFSAVNNSKSIIPDSRHRLRQ